MYIRLCVCICTRVYIYTYIIKSDLNKVAKEEQIILDFLKAHKMSREESNFTLLLSSLLSVGSCDPCLGAQPC